MAYYAINLLASTYGSGDYNVTTYNGSSSLSGGSGSSLSDTGIAIASIVTLAVLLLLVAVVVRIWKRPSKQVSVSVESDESKVDEVNQ